MNKDDSMVLDGDLQQEDKNQGDEEQYFVLEEIVERLVFKLVTTNEPC